MTKPLSGRLREFRDLYRRHVNSHQPPTIDACREMVDRFTDLAEQADMMEVSLAQMEAVAASIEPVAQVAPEDVAALRQAQAKLQLQLDAEDRAARQRANARLAVALPETNVIALPSALRGGFGHPGGDVA